ncbi:MAG: metal ABC transporter substrate-binding protein [candidate division WOR-3 bacterium]
MRKFLAILVLALSCQNEHSAPIVATIYPLTSITMAIAGDEFRVIGIVPPGANPHAYEPTPKNVAALSGARVVIYAGPLMEPWVPRTGTKAILVDASAAGKMLVNDPHVWLDPERGKLIASSVAVALSEAWPEKKEVFQNNLTSFNARVDSFDTWFRSELSSVKDRRFVSVHPAWRYLAARYGLLEVASLGAGEGGEVSPMTLTTTIETMKREDVHAVFGELGSSSPYTRTLEYEAGAKVARLDPIGNPGDTARDDYVDLLYYNGREIIRVLK